MKYKTIESISIQEDDSSTEPIVTRKRKLQVLPRPEFADLLVNSEHHKVDACRAATFNHILYWIARKVADGGKYWYATEKEICEQMNNLWSVNKVRKELHRLILDFQVLGRCTNPKNPCDQTGHYYFGSLQAETLIRLCKKQNVDLLHADLPKEVQALLVHRGVILLPLQEKEGPKKGKSISQNVVNGNTTYGKSNCTNEGNGNTIYGNCNKELRLSPKITSKDLLSKKEESTVASSPPVAVTTRKNDLDSLSLENNLSKEKIEEIHTSEEVQEMYHLVDTHMGKIIERPGYKIQHSHKNSLSLYRLVEMNVTSEDIEQFFTELLADPEPFVQNNLTNVTWLVNQFLPRMKTVKKKLDDGMIVQNYQWILNPSDPGNKKHGWGRYKGNVLATFQENIVLEGE